MKLTVAGTIMVLNTIDHLPEGGEGLISINAVHISNDGNVYLFAKAQYISKEMESEGFQIPIKRDTDGFRLDFTEVPFAFIVADDKLIKSLNKKEWLSISASLEKQKDEYDYIKRLNVEKAFLRFDLALDERLKDTKYDFIRKHLIKKILSTPNKTILEEIISYCNHDYQSDLESTSELSSDEKVVAINYYEDIRADLEHIAYTCKLRLSDLQSDVESSEVLHEKLWLAVEEQKFEEAAALRDKIKDAGYEYVADRPMKV